MKRAILLQIIGVIVTLMLLIKLSTIFFVEPWVREKINKELNKGNRDYLVETDRVHQRWSKRYSRSGLGAKA